MIIGIDPGFTGAIAFLSSGDYTNLVIEDLPTHLVIGRPQIDPIALSEIVSRNTQFAPSQIKCYIEDVHAMPGQGLVSTFRFGYGAGVVYGVLASYTNIDVIRIKPAVWKASLGLSANKKQSLERARKLFPRYREYFKRVKDDGRAEAALIAYFAKKMT